MSLRISHFRRCDASASPAVARDVGGWMREKAEVIREWVRETSRWRNARAARGYRERRVATAEDDDGLEGALREITEGAVVVVVVNTFPDGKESGRLEQ